MMAHEIKSKLKKKKRIGRGGKRGNYSGRGQKGQKARAGRNIKDQNLERILKIPKKRGWKFKPLSEKPTVINLDIIDKFFQENEIVSPITLAQKGLIKPNEKVKILGRGKLTKKLIFENLPLSRKAREKIKAI